MKRLNNPTSDWKRYVRGEYWIDPQGRSEFADLNVGEAGHESIALGYLLDKDVLVDGLLRAGVIGSETAEDLGGDFYDAASVYAEYEHRIPDEVGTAASAGDAPEETWAWIKRGDARRAYAKVTGSILAINTDFGVWKISPTSIRAIQTHLYEMAEEALPSNEDYVHIEEFSTGRYAAVPAQEFLTTSTPREVLAYAREGNPAKKARSRRRLNNPRALPLGDLDTAGISRTLAAAAVMAAGGKTTKKLEGVVIGTMRGQTTTLKGQPQPFLIQAQFQSRPESKLIAHGGSTAKLRNLQTGGFRDELAVLIYFNPRTQAALVKSFQKGEVQHQVERILVHELTHVRTHSVLGKKVGYDPLNMPRTVQGMKDYVNDVNEAPSLTQEIVFEVKQALPKLRGKVGSRRLVESALFMSLTWQIIQRYLTEANERRIVLAVTSEIEDEINAPT